MPDLVCEMCNGTVDVQIVLYEGRLTPVCKPCREVFVDDIEIDDSGDYDKF